jgi:hypothetical protein
VLEFNLHQWPSAAQRHPLRPLDDDNQCDTRARHCDNCARA